MFIKYPKIYRIGAEETDGILGGRCVIEEKIDGANTSVWVENGELKFASRNQEVVSGFNGFVDYVKAHEGINSLLKDYPEYRIYLEWAVRHTVSYREDAYRKAYLFDIRVEDGFLPQEEVHELAVKYSIPTPEIFATFENPTVEQIQEHVGKSVLGTTGEGVVIKNLEFRNKFGDIVYGKIVTDIFKENNAVVFGGNNKHSEHYYEILVMNKYITIARVTKIMNKMQPIINERLDLKHIPQIAGATYHDMLTEEIWAIQKRVQSINFHALKNLCTRKIVQIYKDILAESIS